MSYDQQGVGIGKYRDISVVMYFLALIFILKEIFM